MVCINLPEKHIFVNEWDCIIICYIILKKYDRLHVTVVKGFDRKLTTLNTTINPSNIHFEL